MKVKYLIKSIALGALSFFLFFFVVVFFCLFVFCSRHRSLIPYVLFCQSMCATPTCIDTPSCFIVLKILWLQSRLGYSVHLIGIFLDRRWSWSIGVCILLQPHKNKSFTKVLPFVTMHHFFKFDIVWICGSVHSHLNEIKEKYI